MSLYKCIYIYRMTLYGGCLKVDTTRQNDYALLLKRAQWRSFGTSFVKMPPSS